MTYVLSEIIASLLSECSTEGLPLLRDQAERLLALRPQHAGHVAFYTQAIQLLEDEQARRRTEPEEDDDDAVPPGMKSAIMHSTDDMLVGYAAAAQMVVDDPDHYNERAVKRAAKMLAFVKFVQSLRQLQAMLDDMGHTLSD